MVQAQSRSYDGAINGNLFDEHVAKAPLTNPFAAGGSALSGLRAAAAPLPGPTAGKPAANPFANLDNDAWSKAASPPPQGQVTSVAAPVVSPACNRYVPACTLCSDTSLFSHCCAFVPLQSASPWDAVGSPAAPAPAPAADPWGAMSGTTSGAPMPVMPAQTEEMRKVAAAKSSSNSDLF